MSEFCGAGPALLTPSEQLAGRELGGFDFSYIHRNATIVKPLPGGKVPKAMKTGTTICGVVYAGGIVLGADTRATEGTVISDKNCEKIHYIAPNIYCCGAGTAADTENVTKLISSQLELLRLQTGLESRVVTAMTQLKRRLFQYQGHVSAALVLGGVDVTGPHLYTIYPHGSTDKLPFVSMGSGSLAAMAMLEGGYKDDMTEAEAVALVAAAIRAGIFNDLGSGSNVDITVIRAAKGDDTGAAPAAAPSASSPAAAASSGSSSRVTVLRNYQTPNDVAPLRAKISRPASRHIPRGATVVLSESFRPAAGKKAAGASAVAVDAGGSGAGAGGDRMDIS